MGLSLAVPSGVSLGLRALRWVACVDTVTDAYGFPYRPSSDGGLGRCTGTVSCGRRHHPFLVGGRHARVSCMCACARPLGQDGRAGLPGVFWCASPLSVDGPGALFVCLAPSGLGLPCLWSLLGGFFFPCCAPVVSSVPCLPARGALGLGVLWSSPAPPPCLLLCCAPMSPVFPGFFCFCAPFTPPPFFFCLQCHCFWFVSSFFFLIPLPLFFLFSCLGVPVVRCFGCFVCPRLWGVLVCIAVGVVPGRGPVCACAVSLGDSWLCPFPVCCCLSCCGVVVCFVFCPVVRGVRVLGLVLAPCCCPLLPLPGPLSWPVVVFYPGVPCCVALGCRLSCGGLLSVSCLAGGAVLFRFCWLVLRVVACGCLLFVAGSGCLLLFSAGVCYRGRSCLAAWFAGLLCAVVSCGAPLPSAVSCVGWSCVAGWCRAVVPCCPVSFAGGVGLCPFPVCAVLCCAARRFVPCRFRLRCCCFLVLWSGVSLGVLWCGGAALVCCAVLPCSAVVCGAASPCGPVLLGCAVCFPLLRVFLSPLKTIFRFLKIKIKKSKKIK